MSKIQPSELHRLSTWQERGAISCEAGPTLHRTELRYHLHQDYDVSPPGRYVPPIQLVELPDDSVFLYATCRYENGGLGEWRLWLHTSGVSKKTKHFGIYALFEGSSRSMVAYDGKLDLSLLQVVNIMLGAEMVQHYRALLFTFPYAFPYAHGVPQSANVPLRKLVASSLPEIQEHNND